MSSAPSSTDAPASNASRYVPKVGASYRDENFQDMSRDEIITRDLRDPAYSDAAIGFTTFDWRANYIMRFNDPTTETAVVAKMDEMASTPEGRHILRQAIAMQKLRLAQGDFETLMRAEGLDPAKLPPQMQPDPQGRIILTEGGRGGKFLGPRGAVLINREAIEGNEYVGIDGKPHPSTIGSTLHHELTHAMDPPPHS